MFQHRFSLYWHGFRDFPSMNLVIDSFYLKVTAEDFTVPEVPAQATTPSEGESPKEEKNIN